MPEGQNGGGRGPWGQGPQGGGGPGGSPGPDLEELLRRGQDRFRRARRGGGGGGGGGLPGNFGSMGVGGLIGIILILLAIWLGTTGWYRAETGHRGVVMRFGALDRIEMPGPHLKWPWPIEMVTVLQIDEQRSESFGFREDSSRRGNAREEGIMLTTDENIADITFDVQWFITDPAAYLFNVEDPNVTLRSAAESAMREVASQLPLSALQTQDRGNAPQRVMEITQRILDEYNTGIEVSVVNMETVRVPPLVTESYNDVQSAEQDEQRFENEANRYSRRILEEAQGETARITQEAEGYRDQTIADAQGEAQRFLAIYEEYRLAPDVTRRRMYLETMEQVFGDMDKIIIDNAGGDGVVQYLPLSELQPRSRTSTEEGR